MSTPAIPRPRFHFTPARNWMNDPNGLVHADGLWHLFFQYNPEGSDWGNMSWGHATSPDLHRWTEHPVALRHGGGEQIFSGSVVADRGDGDATPLAPADGERRLTAYYTSAYDDGRQAQSRAVSTDGGASWTRDPANPVLDRDSTAFRDPKVIRFREADGSWTWVMLTVEADDRQVLFHRSRDLRSWEESGRFGPLGPEGVVWECPDLVLLPVEGAEPGEPGGGASGAPAERRWTLLLSTNPVGEEQDPEGSAMHYLVGDFNGRRFTSDATELQRLDAGRDFYAGVTFDSAPHGAAVMIGWMSNWRYAGDVPTAPWRGAMSLPRVLSLRDRGRRLALVQRPAAFVEAALSPRPLCSVATAGGHRVPLSGHSLLRVDADTAATGDIELRLPAEPAAPAVATIAVDVAAGTLTLRRSGPTVSAIHPDFAWTSTLSLPRTDRVRLLVSLDGPLLEVFVEDGEAVASAFIPLGPGPHTAVLTTARGGAVSVAHGDGPSSATAAPTEGAATDPAGAPTLP
ncbi:glycoside hydrolase family 32 protein [Mycetocola reblochoni]|uniref:Sucrose-6-phosphate hydrolase n=2 Tax=Mycetocola reblochoni TaxID=331618 RepID=A0A1R4KCC8_9MICO|nr:glycoside hydrolase family 32 protein [Mycetocola reblochoni]RLP69280.1 glycoside hydrolase family 32 protein [Mycetocola reblochoni]SJN42061.1 Sucrose-6-phosphate hydrolase [Mycetocola reblochoni REB411]